MPAENLGELSPDLPAPADDGGADHLPGRALPPLALPAANGTRVDFSALAARVVVFVYPRTGRPDEPPLAPDRNAALMLDWLRAIPAG